MLARLFFEPEGPWVLKGGYAMELEFAWARSTVDIDLTVRRLITPRSGTGTVLRALRVAGERPFQDYFEFRVGQPTMNLAGAPVPTHATSGFADGWLNLRQVPCRRRDVLVHPLQQLRCTDWLAAKGSPGPRYDRATAAHPAGTSFVLRAVA